MRDLRYSNHKPARHIGPPRVTTLSLMCTYQSTLSRPSPPTYGVLPSNRFCNWRRRFWKPAAADAAPDAAPPGIRSVPGAKTLARTHVPYTDAEDEQIRNHVAENGPRKWKDVAKQLSLVRPVSAESMGTTLVEDRVEDAQQPVLVHGRQ